MTAYEERLINIYNSRTIEELRQMLKLNSQDAAAAANQFNETGLSKHKEDKEFYSRGCEVLRFVIANREFYDVDAVINEVN
jgi:hypothetical protein